MEKTVAEKAPLAIGSYCAGKRAGDRIWCSGQTARACMGVATLHKGVRVGIDCVAEA